MRSSSRASTFADRYGPWAVVFGASEGIGASFVRRIAGEHINVVLVARRSAPLDSLAGEIRAINSVEARTVSVDLSRGDFLEHVASTTADVDVGLMIWNVGATGSRSGVPQAEEFLRSPLSDTLALVQLNCTGPIVACHHFVPRMIERGRGGILLVGSTAGTAGSALTVTYSAAKAFEQIYAEGLWSELRPQGIDVLALVPGATLTPSMQRSGVTVHADFPAMTSDEVAREGLAHLADGPTWVAGEENRAGVELLRSLNRRDAVAVMSDLTRELWTRRAD